MSERILIAGKLGKLFVGVHRRAFGDPRLMVCLYDAPLIHVHLKFVSLNDTGKRIEDPVILYQKKQCPDRCLFKVMPKNLFQCNID